MRRVALLAAVVATVLALAGCGEDASSEDGPQRIELTFEGGDAPPLERVSVSPGQPVELVIVADQPGELHVHSTPEDTIEYSAGTTSYTLTIDQPGVVDVERHDPEALVLQLEVN